MNGFWTEERKLLFDFYVPAVAEGALSFTLVRTSQSWFPFSLVCLNQMLRNLYILLITTKHRSSMNFGGVTLTVLELCPFTNGKIADFFVSVL